MNKLFIFDSIGPNPLDERARIAYANKNAKRVLITIRDGYKLFRHVLPAQPGEAIIDGINY